MAIHTETDVTLEDDRRQGRLRRLVGRVHGRVLDHPMLFVFSVALVVRLITALTIQRVLGEDVALDDDTFSGLARDAAAGTTSHWDDYTKGLYNQTAALLVPLTWMYRLVGPHEIIGQLFVVLLGAITAALVVRLLLEAVEAPYACLGGLFVALLPSQILWSSLVMKDAGVWLLVVALALVIAVAARSSGRNLLWLGIAAIVLLVLLAYLRQHTLVVACWAMALAAIAGKADARVPRVAGAVVIALSVPWAVGLGPGGANLVAGGVSLQSLRSVNAFGADSAFVEPPAPATSATEGTVADEELGALENEKVEELASAANVSQDQAQNAIDAAAESSGKPDAAAVADRAGIPIEKARELIRAAREAIKEEEADQALRDELDPPTQPEPELSTEIAHLPKGLMVMLLEPVLWGRGGSRFLQLARLEMIVWYPLLILAFIGLPWVLKRATSVGMFPVLVGGGILTMYALSEGNIGTAYRHRGEFVWVVGFLAALGVYWLSSRRTGASTTRRNRSGGDD